jgi:thiol-disulfide isomerase/thioredoxin
MSDDAATWSRDNESARWLETPGAHPMRCGRNTIEVIFGRTLTAAAVIWFAVGTVAFGSVVVADQADDPQQQQPTAAPGWNAKSSPTNDGDDGIKTNAAAPAAKSLEDRFRALEKEYNDKEKAYFKASRAAKTAADKSTIYKTMYPDILAYARQFYAMATEEPKGPLVPDILYTVYQIVGHAPYRIKGDEKAAAAVHEQLALARQALEWLHRDYVTDPRLKNFLQQIGMDRGPNVESFLRDVLTRNPDHTAQGLACQALANVMSWVFETPEFFAKNPQMAKDFEKVHGNATISWIKSHDPAAALREAVALHERVVSEFAGVKLVPADPADKQTIGKASEDWLASRSELAIGKVAPEIDGKDVDGKLMKKLSHYRGKVVALVFWASWCGPCMQQVPTERELAKAMAGRPFALLGVNCDYTVAAAKAVMAKESITWPNWYDGDPREEALIETRYHIHGIPAVFLLDADGVIRAKDLRDQSLHKAALQMVKDLEARATK